MGKKEKKYYMIKEDILPESILKTAIAKEMLARGDAEDIQDAVNKLKMARSTYYKYKNGIISFFNADNLEIINISLLLEHMSGILSGVINCIASFNGNILTINQNLPLHGVAYVTLSISVEEMTISADGLINRLGELKGVRSVEVIGKS
jgi:chorismate mutase